MEIIIKPLFILISAFLLNAFLSKTISIFISGVKKQSSLSAHQQRIDTLKNVFKNIVSIVIYVIALLMILKEFNFDTMPILTGAGLLGIAISFGAQSIIKDFISGFFIILENQYNVGDEIKIGDLQGRVMKITFRTTVLKDKKENIIHILNSEIKNIVVLKKTD